ncbi:sugar MFS transporter [Pseudomonadales bacterium]|nr:sugar MFS transporter [Pseudomonadales bacterium]
MRNLIRHSGNIFSQIEYKKEICALGFLFFMWGLISSLNDLLVPYLRGVFDLSYVQAMLVQFSFFSVFFIFSIPLGILVNKIGYQKGIVFGLSVASLGCILFFPAAQLISYPIFLLALAVIAIGVCCLQVAANPYVALLGSKKTASSRLNLTQGFNALGTTFAPFLASIFIFSALGQVVPNADSVKLPYLMIATLLATLAFAFSRLRLHPVVHAASVEALDSNDAQLVNFKSMMQTLMTHKPLMYGALGIFFYVGVEVSIGSLLVNFISDTSIGNMSEAKASEYVVIFWAGSMIGRFAGFFLMYRIRPHRILLFNTVMASLCIIMAVFSSGYWAMWSILTVGLCNSIMFPTIFILAVTKLGVVMSQASGILCLAIIGGAIIPVMQGFLADAVGIQLSLLLALVSYSYIAFFALRGYKNINKIVLDNE